MMGCLKVAVKIPYIVNAVSPPRWWLVRKTPGGAEGSTQNMNAEYDLRLLHQSLLEAAAFGGLSILILELPVEPKCLTLLFWTTFVIVSTRWVLAGLRLGSRHDHFCLSDLFCACFYNATFVSITLRAEADTLSTLSSAIYYFVLIRSHERMRRAIV